MVGLLGGAGGRWWRIWCAIPWRGIWKVHSIKGTPIVTGRQLTLKLSCRPALERQDFVVSPCNLDAVAWLDRWPDWPVNGLVLVGPKGCGKSHLLSAFAWGYKARIVPSRGFELQSIPAVLENVPLVLVDDLNRDCDQKALFHLINLAAQHSIGLVFAWRGSRGQIGIDFAGSRLATAGLASCGNRSSR